MRVGQRLTKRVQLLLLLSMTLFLQVSPLMLLSEMAPSWMVFVLILLKSTLGILNVL